MRLLNMFVCNGSERHGAAQRASWFSMSSPHFEFERNLIRERSRAGLVAVRARGRSGGRRPKLTPQQTKEIKRLMSDPTIPVSQIAECYNVSGPTIYKVPPPREPGVVEAQPVKKKP